MSGLRGFGFGLMITDPPYSSGGQYRGDRSSGSHSKYLRGQAARDDRFSFSGDNRDQLSYLKWMACWVDSFREIAAPGALVASFCDWRQLSASVDGLQCGGAVYRGVYVWDKGSGRPMLGRPRAQCEYVVWGSIGPRSIEGPTIEGCWSGTITKQERAAHATSKPVGLVRSWVGLSRGPVLDPFMGGGTTLLAAKAAGVRAVGIELSRTHCETAARRLDDMGSAAGVPRG